MTRFTLDMVRFSGNYCNRKTFSSGILKYVPKHSPVSQQDVEALDRFIGESRKILVLTGAGISTESGIPDYRSEGVGLYARTNHKPIQYQEFIKSAAARQRYWARNYVGWERFSRTAPNDTHLAIKNLELFHNKVSSVVTQNVDSLHFKAGSKNVIELHGSAFRVKCLDCDGKYSRHDIQTLMTETNPLMKETSLMIRPDGDVEIPLDQVETFKTPFCTACGGVLKPDIVFFGDNVPRERVENVRNQLRESDSLLVLGSSLTVFSAYRFVLQAVEEKKNIGIINIGQTRADKDARLKISAKCGDILPRIC